MNAPPVPAEPATESPPDSPALGSGQMFDAIAKRYDVLNRLLSLGLDQRWRRTLVQALDLPGTARVLDLATGTGDLALQLTGLSKGIEVVGIDPSVEMLAVCKRKRDRANRTAQLHVAVGDGLALPLPDNHFDAATCAFGIRNISDRDQALRELHRVLVPGGRVAILEFSEPRGGVLAPMARFYVHGLVPRIGAVLSGAREYRHLERSIAAFPSEDVFLAKMADAGFEACHCRTLSFGVCSLYLGTRPARGGA